MKTEYQYVTTKPNLWQRLRHGMKPVTIGYNHRVWYPESPTPDVSIHWTKGHYISANGEKIRIKYSAWVDPHTFGLPF